LRGPISSARNTPITDAAYADRRLSDPRRLFFRRRPAATMVVAGLIRPEMKIEIEVTAYRG
jgi:enamine deaminase RidA (YjgF/YER057c/UK114 family)